MAEDKVSESEAQPVIQLSAELIAGQSKSKAESFLQFADVNESEDGRNTLVLVCKFCKCKVLKPGYGTMMKKEVSHHILLITAFVRRKVQKVRSIWCVGVGLGGYWSVRLVRLLEIVWSKFYTTVCVLTAFAPFKKNCLSANKMNIVNENSYLKYYLLFCI